MVKQMAVVAGGVAMFFLIRGFLPDSVKSYLS